ncbi:methyl-accepting chemotaxis protein [Leisingera daeponensis]|uniref:methyl-accepting chemotaxis protein n=1 Tax=Leisingera daeponensis TaxID=405746 RepID=UPI000183999F|nr:methyl-accepting chemotaxis protein [Leisingera daeponensis]EDZ46588.1 methyl-accepting chemotaxis sensory transducer [Rhodobacterales bacterium Y4I]
MPRLPAFLYRLPVRIYSLAVLALGLTAVLTFLMLNQAVNNAYEMRYKELHNVTDAAVSLLRDLDEGTRTGRFTPEQALDIGRERLTALRFGDSGYVFVFDHDLVVQAHPTVPDWVGTNQGGYEDVTGIKVFQELEKIAAAKGAGELTYYFKKPNSDVIEAKIGYVQAFEPFGWIVGTGAYVSDIEADVAAMRNKSLAVLGGGLLLLAVAAYFITRSVTAPLNGLKSRMTSLADGDTESGIPSAGARSELGEIARAVDVFREALIRQKDMEQEQQALEATRSGVVEALSSKLSDLSHGDLTAQITETFPAEYEQLRRDFNSTAQTLSQTVEQVIAAADSIRSGAGEISQASDDLSHRTESQAATLEQTAAALDELTASVKSAAEGARSVEATMEEAKREAETSGEVVQSAVSAMTEIEQSSNQISQIIGVIDDIAFQTNLLALNAGVEAARAGEAGRGFAVVASEVRALAQRSSDAAMEIKTLISNSSGQVARGVELVGKAGEALQSIVSQVNHISELVSGIAEGAAEQSTGLNEINTGVTQLDQVTQQNAAMVEQSTAAGQLLKEDATRLTGLVAHFKIHGTRAAAPARAAAVPARPAAAPAPTAHGPSDWDMEATPQPAAISEGNAARDLWQDF